jgi:Holliday junction resolvase RusA-like endonuclease
MKGRPPLSGPVALELVFCVGLPPKTHRRKKLTDALKRLCAFGAFLSGADIDNYEKTVLDAGNGIVWDDDVQVVQVCKKKIHGGEEWTLISVRELK